MRTLRTMCAMLAVAVTAAGCAVGAGDSSKSGNVVTVYAADGWHSGEPNFFSTKFKEFEEKTGIKVEYVEAGSAEVASRVRKERGNPQGDVLMTMDPFIDQVKDEGLLEEFVPEGAETIPVQLKDQDHTYTAMANNFACFVYNKKVLKHPPSTWQDLLDPKYENKLQYSTPGVAGDGTSLLVNALHVLGDEDAAMEYFRELQQNNVGPSSSTGKLTALVNRGDLWVANGDLHMNLSQMTENPNIGVTILRDQHGKRVTLSTPPYLALVKDAPNPGNGKKLIEFLLSKAAQKDIGPLGNGFPARKDISPTGMPKKIMSGVTVWKPDWAELGPDLPGIVQKWQSATQG